METTKQTFTLAPEASDYIRNIKTDQNFAYMFFYEQLKPMTNGIATQLSRCYKEHIDAEEISTLLYLTLWDQGTWSRLDSYSGRCSFFSWLRVVASHEAFRHFDEMGYRRHIKATPGNTRLRLLRQPLSIRKAVVDLVSIPEFHRYLWCRYVDKLSDRAICQKLSCEEDEIEDVRKASVKTLKVILLNTKNDYAELVLRKTADNNIYVGDEVLERVIENEKEETAIESYLKGCHGIDYEKAEFEKKLEIYIRKNAAQIGLKNGIKLDIFIERVVYRKKPEKLAEKFNVKRSYVDNIKSKSIKRFSEYLSRISL